MSYHIGLQVLRAKICGFQVAGLTISSRISRSKGSRKARLWNKKRELGLHCRYHLVAYGLLRGVPYDRIERCAPENKLNPKRVLEIMQAHAGWDPQHDNRASLYDLEKVTTLLSTSEPLTSVVAPTVSLVEAPSTPTDLPQTLSPAATLRSTSPSLLGRSRRFLEKRT